ncbi:MAG TPA: hypothetical protein ENG48_02730 [Candidatus Atribacteria bacterium]|nr:hypothetical protein [Candidatus Atribacteria bacterium]
MKKLIIALKKKGKIGLARKVKKVAAAKAINFRNYEAELSGQISDGQSLTWLGANKIKASGYKDDTPVYIITGILKDDPDYEQTLYAINKSKGRAKAKQLNLYKLQIDQVTFGELDETEQKGLIKGNGILVFDEESRE